MSQILVVEDNPINQEILVEVLHDAGFAALVADDGQAALARLSEQADRISAILLDRMLPDMDGLDVLKAVKDSPALAHIPVIMQTAKSDQADILEGLKGGAYYYLTKPFYPDTLLAIVNTAVSDYQDYIAIRAKVRQTAQSMRCLTRGTFAFRSPTEARDIAALLANTCDDAQKIVLGLSELMLNAVEHGNLAISYAEKTELVRDNRLQAEIEHRLADPAYAALHAVVEFEHQPGELRFVIRDQGCGFDWRNYLELSPERVFDNHGRGIAMARLISFERIGYNETGNEVTAVVRIPAPAGAATPVLADSGNC